MISSRGNPITILLADDDPDDRMLALDALSESRLGNKMYCVEDGEELMEYLRHQGSYADPACAPRPGVILLDLNMPHMDGREAIRALKADPELRLIPIVVLTTSKAQQDVLRSYELGVSSFIVKPVTFADLVEVMQEIGRYWFQIVELPQDDEM